MEVKNMSGNYVDLKIRVPLRQEASNYDETDIMNHIRLSPDYINGGFRIYLDEGNDYMIESLAEIQQYDVNLFEFDEEEDDDEELDDSDYYDDDEDYYDSYNDEPDLD